MTQKSLRENKTPTIQLSLPAKISGIVFWGMMLVGLLVAVYLLQFRENVLITQYQTSVILISNDIESVLEENTSYTKIQEALNLVFAKAEERYNVRAISFDYAAKHYELGERQPDQDQITHAFRVHDKGDRSVFVEGELYVYVDNFEQSISALRKKMLLVIGSLVFIFGLILQRILYSVLSHPFIDMVRSAENFANGDSHVRFDEVRKDEFGYMAKFINRALDSILRHQSELEFSRKELFEEKERAEVTLQSIIDGVITTSSDSKIQYMNPVAERLTGWTSHQAINRNLNDVVKIANEETGQLVTGLIEQCLRENTVEHQSGHASLIRNDIDSIPIEVSVAPMRSDEGEVIGAVMVLQDVSQARRLARQLSFQASHDALTGLCNRRMFEEHLQDALLNVQEEDRHHTMCYIDLDQFKIVNDTCGHMAGDELLRQIAVMLQGCIREVDTLARLGGDEFGLLLQDCPLRKASQIANKIRRQVKDYRFGWEDKSFEIGASIGVVNINAENLDMTSIMSAADIACYAAKDLGRNRVHIYESTDETLVERHGQMSWVSRIVDAIEHDKFVLYQQPEVPLDPEDHCKHFEILVRIKELDNSLILPDSFIPAAERYNLMPKVDRWVIKNVFESMARRREKMNGKQGEQVVAINLSGLSLADDDLLEFILAKQKQYDIKLEEICFEITETATISNLAKATQFMNKLKKFGCQFALDDFGSGLSSFAYLKNLPVDYIKIDGSFVVDIVSDPIDSAMVEAITSLARVMKIQIIAEWVENQETLDMLEEIGVDFVQGYHVGRPEVF